MIVLLGGPFDGDTHPEPEGIELVIPWKPDLFGPIRVARYDRHGRFLGDRDMSGT